MAGCRWGEEDARAPADRGPQDAWFAGLDWSPSAGFRPLVEHFDGRRWAETPLPDTIEDVNAISATSATEVWVMGATPSGPVTLRWNGSAWHAVKPPKPALGPGVGLVEGDVLSVGPRDAWATAILAKDEGVWPGTVLWHWNGKRWRLVPVDAPQDSLTRLAPDGTGGLWMVSAGPRPTAYLLHYTRGSLTREPAPVQPDTTANVDDLTLIPGTRSLWGASTLVDESGHSAAAIDRYDPAS